MTKVLEHPQTEELREADLGTTLDRMTYEATLYVVVPDYFHLDDLLPNQIEFTDLSEFNRFLNWTSYPCNVSTIRERTQCTTISS